MSPGPPMVWSDYRTKMIRMSRPCSLVQNREGGFVVWMWVPVRLCLCENPWDLLWKCHDLVTPGSWIVMTYGGDRLDTITLYRKLDKGKDFCLHFYLVLWVNRMFLCISGRPEQQGGRVREPEGVQVRSRRERVTDRLDRSENKTTTI